MSATTHRSRAMRGSLLVGLATFATYAASCAAGDGDRDTTRIAAGSLAVDSTVAPTRSRRSTRSHDPVRVPILVYHSVAEQHPGQSGEQRELDVDSTTFREQMDYLTREHHPVIAFADLIDALEGRAVLPEGAVVITFDDGWKDQFTEAFPILQQHKFTATFFVYTQAISNGPGFMTWDDLRALRDAGMTIGSHSRTHPVLTVRGVALTEEVDGSREDIMRHLGTTPELFAYPYGEWDRHVADVVQTAGYRAARALGDGPSNAISDRFALNSILVTTDMKAFERDVGGGNVAQSRAGDLGELPKRRVCVRRPGAHECAE